MMMPKKKHRDGFLFHMTDKRLHAKVQQFCELTAISPHLFIYNVLRQAVPFGCLTLFKDLVLFFLINLNSWPRFLYV